MHNPIEEKRRLVKGRIAKSFNSGINITEEMSIEKARHGIYADNAKNRKLGRVGQEYGTKKQEESNVSKPRETGKKKTIDNHVNGASTDALKQAAAGELDKRNSVFNEIRNKFYGNVSDDDLSYVRNFIQASADGINGDKKEIVLDKNKNTVNKKHTTFDEPELKGIKIYNNGNTATLEYKGETKVLYDYDDYNKELLNVKLDITREMARKTGVPFGRDFGSLKTMVADKKDYKKWFGTTDGYAEFKDKIKKVEDEAKSILLDFYEQNTSMSDFFRGKKLSKYDVETLQNWKKKIDSKQGNIPYVDKYDVEELLGGYHTYISGEDEPDHHTGVGGYDYKAIRKKLKDSVKKYGSLKVATSIVDASIGADSGEGVIQNKDEAKCELSGIFDSWKIKTDEETKKFLEYNEDNVWWA